MASQAHVPAWKRIGLKLKYAKDAPEAINDASSQSTPQEPPIDSAQSKKRNRDQNERAIVENHAAKRQRKSDHTSRDSGSGSKVNSDLPPASTATSKQIEVNRNYGFGATHNAAVASNKHTKFDGASDQEDAPKPSSLSPEKDSRALKRRKSVTFTSDTKSDDGFSAQDASKQWFAQQKGADSAVSSSEPSPSPPTPTTIKEKKQKPPPKPKGAAKVKTTPKHESRDGPKYVTYLETFHTDKDNWKFSKATQNDVLKNVWDLHRIPAKHNTALYDYLAGLQGNAARARLIEGARAVLQEIEDKYLPDASDSKMESEEARKAAYEAAKQRDWVLLVASGQQDFEANSEVVQDLKYEAERGERAEAVLGDMLKKALGYPAEAPAPTTAPVAAAAVATTTAAPKKTSRKSRTEVSSSEESSSSESESDSDSESSKD